MARTTLPVIDVIVGACANSLNINIKIFENHQGFKKEIDFEPEKNHYLFIYSTVEMPALGMIFIMPTAL